MLDATDVSKTCNNAKDEILESLASIQIRGRPTNWSFFKRLYNNIKQGFL